MPFAIYLAFTFRLPPAISQEGARRESGAAFEGASYSSGEKTLTLLGALNSRPFAARTCAMFLSRRLVTLSCRSGRNGRINASQWEGAYDVLHLSLTREPLHAERFFATSLLETQTE